MIYRKLGASDFEVSVLAFGAWQLGDTAFWGDDADADVNNTVSAAIDEGVNLFDTAELYGDGESERALGAALKDKRDQVYIASKISTQHCTPKGVRTACEASLERLGTTWIDLYQVHWPFDRAQYEDVYAALDTLKSEGKIRAIGVSNFGPNDLNAWMETGSAVSNQLGYNLLFRAPEYAMIPACRRHGLGVLVYMPLMQGLLSGRYMSIDEIPVPRRRTRHFSGDREGTRHGLAGHEEVVMDTVADLFDFSDAVGIAMPTLCLSWLIAQPGVTSVIVGARKVEQLRANLEAATLDIGPAAIAQLNEYSFPLKVAMGDNCDMWESEQNGRIQ